MADSKISWTEKVWNPVTGCTKISAGCKHCYAERMAKRLQAMGQPNYVNAFKVTLHPDMLELPLTWKKPRIIFVNSMSDLFHDDVPDKFIGQVWSRMLECHWHTFQVLTKRAERMQDIVSRLVAEGERKGLRPASNIWMGVSVENQQAADERIPYLLRTPAAVRFLSCEPLLEAIDLGQWFGNSLMKSKKGDWWGHNGQRVDISWCIVGGESGPNNRVMFPDWVRSIRNQCRVASVPFFFKQMGGYHHGSDLLDGIEYKEFPKGYKLCP